MSQEQLKKVILFTENDLEANRRGAVTPAQIERLKGEVSRISGIGIGGILFSVVLFVAAAAVFSGLEYKKPLLQNIDSLPSWLTFLAVFGLIAFVFGVFAFLWGALHSKAYDGRLEVKVTEGKVERFAPGVDEYSHRIKIGDAEFHVDEKTHDAFTGDHYRLYFLDSSDILSVEEIKRAKTF